MSASEILEYHPLAEIFPLIEGVEFEALVADMREHGQREKIVLVEGKILDGRNRYRAAVAGDLPAAHGDADCFRDFDPVADGDLVAFVLSKNLTRRHLDESQRAMAAARLANLPAHRPSDKSANLLTSQNDAAKRLNVSLRLVTAAKAVQDAGSARIQQLVDQGKLAVSQAVKAARLAMSIQDQVADLAAAGKANAVRTAIKKSERNSREEKLAKKIQALPDEKFGIILADPEWEFVVFNPDTGSDRSPDQHYPTSSEKEISNRDVWKISAKDSMLCMWVTDLARGIRVMELWGFQFKSYFVWVKDFEEIPTTGIKWPKAQADWNGKTKRVAVECGPAGTGYWNRDRDELLLIGTRGNFVAPAMGTQPESVFFAPRPKLDGEARGRHSAKPDFIHLWIELNWPNTPKIELNARGARQGWTVWGNEAPQEDPPIYDLKSPEDLPGKIDVETVKTREQAERLAKQVFTDSTKIITPADIPEGLTGNEVMAAVVDEIGVIMEEIATAPAINISQQNRALNEKTKPAAEFDGVKDLPAFLKRKK